jgi:hypothetical protein
MPTLAADYTNISPMVVAKRRAIAGPTGVIRLAATPLTYYSPSPSGGFAQKFKIESKVDRFRSLNVNKLASKPTFWAKPPPGEGGVRAKQSQGECLGFLDWHTLI